MSAPEQAAVRNRLLSLMAPKDFALLAPDLEALDLPKGFVLLEQGGPIERVFFPDSGIGSVIAVSPEGAKVEAGPFGFDGVSPVGAVLGLDRAWKQEIMQVAGSGHTIGRKQFDTALHESATLRSMLNAYVYTMLLQTAYSVLSNGVHGIDERLARWLLMCDDRTDGMEIALTHNYISIMLAVRRPSVTTALHVLEGNGYIRNERGVIVIRDRKGLEGFAADAHGAPEAEYRPSSAPCR